MITKTKRLIAMLIAALMLITVLVSCSSKTPPAPPAPSGDSDNTTSNNNSNPGSNPGNSDTPAAYQPSVDCNFNGAVGFGAAAGTAYFDNITVTDRTMNSELLAADFESEENAPEFKTLGGDAATLTTVDDPIEKAAEKDITNHAVSVDGGNALVSGDTIWNYYSYICKVLPADENTVVEVYFLVTDENNYFVLSLGEDGNTHINVYQVKDGVKSEAQFRLNKAISTTDWTTVGVMVDNDIIRVFLNGTVIYRLFDETVINDYHEYNGTIIPASISELGYGAPDVNLEYIQIDESHVIHDGKGSYGGSLSCIASKVFDMNTSTYYDCDEKDEKPGATEGELIGIPGDGTYPYAYVGAKFDEAITIKYVRIIPRSGYASRTAKCKIEASLDGVTWVVVGETGSGAPEGGIITVRIEDDTPYNYYRYCTNNDPNDRGYGNAAEIEFWAEK